MAKITQTIYKIAALSLLISGLLLSGCSSDPQIPDGADEEGFSGASSLSIAALKSLYVGGSQRLTEVIFISGSITATDFMGEYPSTLIIEDDTGALKVSVDLDGAFSSYPIGGVVTINCTDLWIGSYGGTLLLGCEPTEDYVVDAIDIDDFKACSSVVVEDVVARTPQAVTLSQLSQQLVACYLQLDGMRFLTTVDDEGEVIDTFCALNDETGRRVTTIHTLEEVASGEQINLYVASTVDYANELLPSGEGSIYVTLSLYGSSYSVSLVSRRFSFDGLE